MNRILFIALLMTLVQADLVAQQKDNVFVDSKGIMRWGKSKKEVYGFGVNYTAMFAHAYRTAREMNISIEKAIDNDVYHFARLGFDLYRVHVWDCEISDTVGNLLANEHLRLFDYALSKMKERGMNFIITPIAYWGNGWPQPDEKTPGFSTKYGKDACLTNEEAIKAQEKYLFQFLNHVNEFTGVAMKNESSIIGFEICNEPHHSEAPAKVTAFINRMVKSMRNSGTGKPIFYNISHSIHLEEAYFDAAIQGGTFQWYPTGLGSGHELGGNLLPNVNKYKIPFANNARFKKMAKVVYEFDAADVGRSYIYPAMARSFRETGMQVAAHFSYDPTFMANINTEYGTHYMNLAYAPQKALSLKIASAVFHKIPLYKSFGVYPSNVNFDDFHVNYVKDLAEMVTPKEYFYTNNTATSVVSDLLEHIAGWGNSSVIRYEGTGAYFADRLEPGVWRLEVMPDALWISDPFGRTSPMKEVAVINWRKWPITINLTDLGDNYAVEAINDGNSFAADASGKSFSVSPGVYLLKKKGVAAKHFSNDRLGNIMLKEFAAPSSSVNKVLVLHQPPVDASADKAVTIEATVVSGNEPASVEIRFFESARRWNPIVMKRVNGYKYAAEISEGDVKEGFLKYYITVNDDKRGFTFPSGTQGRPVDWDFLNEQPYEIRVVNKSAPIYLFNASTDAVNSSHPWVRSSTLKPIGEPGRAEWLVNIDNLDVADPENKNGEKHPDYSIRFYFGKKVAGRIKDMETKNEVVFKGRSLNEKPCTLQLALINTEGLAYGATLNILPGSQDYKLNIADLKPVALVTLPRPYPSFLSYYLESSAPGAFDLSSMESLQISIGPGIPVENLGQKWGFAVESVRLE